MAFIFDGINKIIQITSGTTFFTVKDCYNDWKDWVITENNTIYEQAFRYVGGDPLPGSKALGVTYFLMNGWKIRPASENHTLNVDGNLYTEDGSSPFTSVIGNYSVMVISSVSTLVDSTIQQLPEIEYATFNGGVHLDPILGIDSIEYPAGTPFRPCKTILNAYMIDLVRGFNKVYLYGDLDIINFPDGFIKDVEVYGVGGYRIHNVYIENTLVENVLITNLNATGVCKVGSNVHVHDCKIENLENISIIADDSRINSGHYTFADLNRCVVDGDIVLTSGGYFTGVGVVFEGDYTNIEMGENSIVSLDVDSGYLLLKNSTSGCLAEFNYKGGELELDPSCTGGDFYAEGVGYLYSDPIALGMNVKANHLISLETVTETNWNYDITSISATNTMAGYIKNKVLSVAKFIGLS